MAEMRTEHMGCVVGMRRAIGDRAAVRFAASFYRALAFGCSVANAFEQGLVSLELEGIGEADTPELIVRRSGVSADRVVLVVSQDANGRRESEAAGPGAAPGAHLVPASQNKEAALHALLAESFDGDAAGLRQWIRLSLGKEIHDALPGGSVSLSQLAFETVLALQRHGQADAMLFASLQELRPRWADRIRDVARLYGIASQTEGQPEDVRGEEATNSAATANDRRVTMPPLDPLAQKIEDALKRKQRLEAAGLPTDDVLAELRQLKREHRRGGRLRPGDELGDRYLLVEQIGRGGFATVWRARDSASGDDVAIKVLHPESAGDLIRRQRFFRGARIMAELDHPTVVKIREQEAEDDGFFYFVMDYIPGGNLHDAVLDGRVQREHAVPLVLRIGEAIADAHARGHVHRDIKPANILLTASGEPRLTDFDLVTAQDTTGGTRTGALGTFLYAPPEMMERPQEADARADVYGLGMTLVFVSHGHRLPLRALTARERFIHELSCPAALKATLKQATCEDAEQRYPDAAAFCEALTLANLSQTEPDVLTASGLSIPPGVKHSAAKRRTPWAGYWYVNVGNEGNRSWADQRRFGFVTAGGGLKYSGPLHKLKKGNAVFAYLRGKGYVGYGIVRSEATRVTEAQVNGKRLLDLPLERPGIANKHANDPERAEYIVGIDWKATVDPADAKTFKGIFTYRNIVCRLREKETIEFLEREFGVQE